MLPRGAEPLIAMRKAGNAPTGSVMVSYGDFPDPVWHRYSNTMRSPELVVRFTDPVERLDFRCTLKLDVILFASRYDDKVAALFARLKEYAAEISWLSPDFGNDLGMWWLPKYGDLAFDDRAVVSGYEDARSECTSASLRRDAAAYTAARNTELRLLKEHSWLRC